MTYWGYHLIFTIPLLAVLFWVHRKRLENAHLVVTLIILAIVMIFTTPWDNFAVWLGIWGFGENVSLGTPFANMAENTPFIGHIPFEEMAFFVIESLMVILVCLFFLPSRRNSP